MKMFFKKTGTMQALAVLLLIGGTCLFCGCSRQTQRIQMVDTAMGTIVSQTLYIEGRTIREQQDIVQEILFCIHDLEQQRLSWRLSGSEIYEINANAGEENGIGLSPKLSEHLNACLRVSEASQGAFDITIGDVVRLWDIDTWAGKEETKGFVIPSESEINAALEKTGYQKISLQDNRIILPKPLQLDMGAVGKGIALDEIKQILEAYEEITGAVVSVGGSILTYGTKSDGSLWNVGIVNPSETSENIGVLKLEGGWCVSTSGDYERFVEKDGVRYHHILNPETGYPAESGVRSVTIVTQNGLLSDALSTACFILGEEEGLALAEEFEAEALFVLEDGRISMTEGMQQFFELTVE